MAIDYKLLTRDEMTKISNIVMDYALAGQDDKADLFCMMLTCGDDSHPNIDEVKKAVGEGRGRYTLA